MEGAQLPWKVQRINEARGPAGDYKTIHGPLPKPPVGMMWEHNAETREWKLVPTQVERVHEEGDTKRERSSSISSNSSSEDAAGETKQVNYLVHTVLPTDTLQGLCIKYKITATKLRQANRFSGSNLLLAPAKLTIPLRPGVVVEAQDVKSPEFKIQFLRAELPSISTSEARAYLEMADWDLADATEAARSDVEWELSQKGFNSSSIIRNYMERRDRSHLEVAQTGVPVSIGSPPSPLGIQALNEAATKLFIRKDEQQGNSEMEMKRMMVPLMNDQY